MNSSANGINHDYMYNKGYRWLITLEDGRTLYGKTFEFCCELMRTDFKDEKNYMVTSLVAALKNIIELRNQRDDARAQLYKLRHETVGAVPGGEVVYVCDNQVFRQASPERSEGDA